MSVAARRYVERLVARRVITAALAAGYALSVNDGEEFTIERCTDPRRIFAALCTTDEDFLHVHRPSVSVAGRPASETLFHTRPFGWIKFVYGNDAVDLISDYTTNLDDLIKPIYDWIATSIDRTEWNIQEPAAAPSIGGHTFTRTIWTCTTDGNNRPLTTTVHATEADAYARVRADLEADCPAHQIAHLRTIPDADLVPGWEGYCDGPCIIEPHNIEVEA